MCRASPRHLSVSNAGDTSRSISDYRETSFLAKCLGCGRVRGWATTVFMLMTQSSTRLAGWVGMPIAGATPRSIFQPPRPSNGRKCKLKHARMHNDPDTRGEPQLHGGDDRPHGGPNLTPASEHRKRDWRHERGRSTCDSRTFGWHSFGSRHNVVAAKRRVRPCDPWLF